MKRQRYASPAPMTLLGLKHFSESVQGSETRPWIDPSAVDLWVDGKPVGAVTFKRTDGGRLEAHLELQEPRVLSRQSGRLNETAITEVR